MNEDLSKLRVDYGAAALTSKIIGEDPMRCFHTWFQHARRSPMAPEPNAAAFATCSDNGTPSVRMVLLKGVDDDRAAFTVYTNLDGRKAREAMALGRASLCWWWPGEPSRQVRVGGRVELVARTEVERYFASRPPAAQVGAAASDQSRAIPHRATLEECVAALDPKRLSMPERWGGLSIVADEIEFWQGRTGRLHDRFTFLRVGEGDVIASDAAVDAAGGTKHVRRIATMVHDEHGGQWLRMRLAP